ncbi:hypothetical protein [Heyndrickxia oleronia]|uniref:hypothetical protein n=1 Tax=Heyndrickxia oleronia TaxID=38875 RepID=UPI001C0EF6D9|nr:hypothetical protein [Heyndrickxia oleronia]MBU5214371.1 hypothetical protein [Heyndrickxia oleronia]
MIAYINGITVQGTPEEIEQYRAITAKKVTSTHGFFKQVSNDVPEHVKRYGKSSVIYTSKGSNVRAWL